VSFAPVVPSPSHALNCLAWLGHIRWRLALSLPPIPCEQRVLDLLFYAGHLDLPTAREAVTGVVLNVLRLLKLLGRCVSCFRPVVDKSRLDGVCLERGRAMAIFFALVACHCLFASVAQPFRRRLARQLLPSLRMKQQLTSLVCRAAAIEQKSWRGDSYVARVELQRVVLSLAHLNQMVLLSQNRFEAGLGSRATGHTRSAHLALDWSLLGLAFRCD